MALAAPTSVLQGVVTQAMYARRASGRSTGLSSGRFGPGSEVLYTAVEEVVLPLPWHRGRVVLIGDAAQGEVTMMVEYDGQSFRGHGASADIVEAGCRACLEVMNRILRGQGRGAAGPLAGPAISGRAGTITTRRLSRC